VNTQAGQHHGPILLPPLSRLLTCCGITIDFAALSSGALIWAGSGASLGRCSQQVLDNGHGGIGRRLARLFTALVVQGGRARQWLRRQSTRRLGEMRAELGAAVAVAVAIAIAVARVCGGVCGYRRRCSTRRAEGAAVGGRDGAGGGGSHE
jgi:hypothetical protein